MGSRLNLHDILCEIVNITDPTNGDRHVYFQPPESLRMKYPAIRYSLNDINNTHASDGVYTQSRSYEIIIIDPDPDSEIVDKVSKLPLCRFNRAYKSDNLNHWVFTLYF
jgi:hypothetical protein